MTRRVLFQKLRAKSNCDNISQICNWINKQTGKNFAVDDIRVYFSGAGYSKSIETVCTNLATHGVKRPVIKKTKKQLLVSGVYFLDKDAELLKKAFEILKKRGVKRVLL